MAALAPLTLFEFEYFWISGKLNCVWTVIDMIVLAGADLAAVVVGFNFAPPKSRDWCDWWPLWRHSRPPNWRTPFNGISLRQNLQSVAPTESCFDSVFAISAVWQFHFQMVYYRIYSDAKRNRFIDFNQSIHQSILYYSIRFTFHAHSNQTWFDDWTEFRFNQPNQN